MKMKIALVTGANKGLGFATARQLGRSGATVIVGARDAARGKRAVEELRADGIVAEPLALDVTDPVSVRAAAEEIKRRHGRLDVLVNNAGVLPEATRADRVGAPLDAAMFRETFETNVFGAVAVTQALLPLLKASQAGRIVNVSSTMGSLSDQTNPESPYYGVVMPAYQASKAALNCMTIALAKALAGSKVKTNSVCPGWVQTDLGGEANKAAAPLTPEQAAHVVADAALVGEDGPSGAFIDAEGTVGW
jgi:NAD(P)-dependent dehydrogenase (short-subunit alcohol dehydrogenase family)